jgi:hypothetical protein
MKASISTPVLERYAHDLLSFVIVRGSRICRNDDEPEGCPITTPENLHPTFNTSDSICHFINDIRKDPPDSWWFFHEGRLDPKWNDIWTCINYKRKIIYRGHRSVCSYHWVKEWELEGNERVRG